MKRRHFWSIFGLATLAHISPIESSRAAAPAGRYTVGTITVLDTKTGLTWQKMPATSPYPWIEAMSYCSGIGSSLGGTGWHLPTIKELQTLVDYKSPSPAIDGVFAPTPLGAFWSATLVAGSPSRAWYVFYDGSTANSGGDITLSAYVRCVR
jgi:hypothetical protein